MKSEKGFTIIELLVVVAIVGILAAVSLTAYVGVKRKAMRSEGYSSLESLRMLQEQFFAENGRYTITQGILGDTAAVRDANLNDIQNILAPGDDALPGFRPGNAAKFAFRLVQNNQINIPLTDPPTWAPIPLGGPPCFVAVATALVNTPIENDIFVIDCNNNRNF